MLKEAPIRWLVQQIHNRPIITLLAALVVTVGALYMAITGIGIKSGMKDLLPESAPSVRALDELNRRLGSADILIAALLTEDFEAVIPHLPGIGEALSKHPDIRRVEWRQDVDLIDRNSLIIFPTLEELKAHYSELRKRIRDEVKKRMQLLDEDDPSETKDPKSDAFETYTFAWAEHERDDGLSNLGRTFREGRGKYREHFYNRKHTAIALKIYPVRSSGDLKFCQQILKVADTIITEQLKRRFGGVGEGRTVSRFVLGGGYQNTVNSSTRVQSDMLSSVGISFGILALIIILFFRSLRALFCVMIPVVTGIVWTAGLVALTVGYVNLITAFIFAILLGLGIDFGIHFYARYREAYALGKSPLEAMVETHLHCGTASILAAITTSCAFASLSIADFRGFSQFGGVAAAGVLLSLLAVFIVFTGLTFFVENIRPMRLRGYKVSELGAATDRKPFPLGARFVVFAVLLAVACFSMAGQIEFELDFNKLTYQEKTGPVSENVTRGTSKSTAPAVIFADSDEEAQYLYSQLKSITSSVPRHPVIKEYQSLFSLVPKAQEEKIKWVHKICRKLKRKVKLFEGDPREGADEILKRCDPKPFSTVDLPDWVRNKFSDKRDKKKLGQFIFVTPRGSISDGNVALKFQAVMRSLKLRPTTEENGAAANEANTPIVSGKPMVLADIITAMYRDGKKTTIAALLTVLLLLMLFERRLTAVTLILLPLVLGIGYSIGVMVLLGIKLSFFNMLALPTLIGMGVDDGVHIYHRHREMGPGSARYVIKTTGMAVVLTSLTTSVGFASLVSASTFGLKSLGLLSILGISTALITTLLVMPAAMQWLDSRGQSRGAES